MLPTESSQLSITSNISVKEKMAVTFAVRPLRATKSSSNLEPDAVPAEIVESTARLYVINSFRARTKEGESWISETGKTSNQRITYDLGTVEVLKSVKIVVDASDLTAPRECSLSCAFEPNGSFQHASDFVVELTAGLQMFPVRGRKAAQYWRLTMHNNHGSKRATIFKRLSFYRLSEEERAVENAEEHTNFHPSGEYDHKNGSKVADVGEPTKEVSRPSSAKVAAKYEGVTAKSVKRIRREWRRAPKHLAEFLRNRPGGIHLEDLLFFIRHTLTSTGKLNKSNLPDEQISAIYKAAKGGFTTPLDVDKLLEFLGPQDALSKVERNRRDSAWVRGTLSQQNPAQKGSRAGSKDGKRRRAFWAALGLFLKLLGCAWQHKSTFDETL